MRVFDFDKTIYDGDASFDFWRFMIKKKPMILYLFGLQLLCYLMMKIGIISREKAKSVFFKFLRYSDKKDLEKFWQKNYKKIKNWYLEEKKSGDLIISASPEYILEPIAQYLEVDLIATRVDKKTGKIIGKNCRGKEKVRRFFEKYPEKKIEIFYSDSLSDLPMRKIANRGFLIKGARKKEWKI